MIYSIVTHGWVLHTSSRIKYLKFKTCALHYDLYCCKVWKLQPWPRTPLHQTHSQTRNHCHSQRRARCNCWGRAAWKCRENKGQPVVAKRQKSRDNLGCVEKAFERSSVSTSCSLQGQGQVISGVERNIFAELRSRNLIFVRIPQNCIFYSSQSLRKIVLPAVVTQVGGENGFRL